MNADTVFHSPNSNSNIVYFPDLKLTLTVKLCDLLYEETNVIVNASNTELFLGGGISGAIRQKGGSSIQEELNQIRKEKKIIHVGEVEITSPGLIRNSNLRKIFHAVGPRYSNTINNDNLLKKTFHNCLIKAEENGFTSISIPPISSGIFRYPLNTVCSVFYSALASFINDKFKCNESFILSEIYFCNNDDEGYNVMVDSLKELNQNLISLGNTNMRMEYKFSKVFSEGELSSQFPQDEFDEKKVKESNEIFMNKLKKSKPSVTKENVRRNVKEDKSNIKITNFFGKK
jgi:O-acetyl-ADP-ribose deacetylase (regulator of RNase III)